VLVYANILVIQTAFIGDAILASSLVEKLHAKFPGARISVLVRKGNETLFDHHPFLHEVLTWDKKENKFGNLLRTLGTIRKRRFDCVINCHRYASSGILTGFSGARHTAGYKQNPFSFLFNHTVKHVIGDGRHEIERYNQLVSDFSGPELFKPVLYPSAQDRAAVSHFLDIKYVCIAPASVWFTKQLPQYKWEELCRLIPADTSIYLLGANSDKDLCDAIQKNVGRTDVKVLAGQLSFLQSCALMEHAVMNYVNDSAPLHLASSVNAPVTAYFCSTVPEFGFGPLSTNARVIGVPLPCRPCGIVGYKACPLGHFRCAHEMPMT
jgi:ADP-heptose:LPS heptosyltransferase